MHCGFPFESQQQRKGHPRPPGPTGVRNGDLIRFLFEFYLRSHDRMKRRANFVHTNSSHLNSVAFNEAGVCYCRNAWATSAHVVESRSGAVAVRPCRFQIPLIKPDVRISRIRLSDQGGFMLSPTGGCAWSVPDGPGRASRRDTRRGRHECQLPDVGVWRTTTVAADIGYGHLRRDRLWLQGPT